MLTLMRSAFCIVLAFLPASCDTESKAGPYAELTTSERARQALDDGDYELAIEYYTTVLEEDPEDYESYRFLAAAYASAGGFDVFTAIQGTLEGAADGEGNSPLQALGDFVPADPTDEQIENLRLAVATIERLPAEYRRYEDTEIETASSAAQQLEFYQTAYSLTSINKFAKVTEEGSIDPEQLETMTAEDVDDILGSFESIAASGSDSVMGEAAADILAQIDAAPGESRRDKLIDYLNGQGN